MIGVGGFGVAGAASASADRPSHIFDVSSIAIAPDGLRLFAGQGLGAPYAVLHRDPASNLLQFRERAMLPGEQTSSMGEFQRTIAVSPDGSDVYDSLNGLGAVRHMRVAGDSVAPGGLYANHTNGIVGLTGASQVAVAPDGRCLHVTANAIRSAAIASFRRASDGTLSFVESVPGDTNAWSWGEMAFSSDGTRMYVVAGSGVGVFTRDPDTCKVSLSSFQAAAFGHQLTGLALAPDGRTLYSVDAYSSWLHTSTVDPTTGELTLVDSKVGGLGGLGGLDGVNGVVVSPDGKHVYVSAANERAVTAFTRGGDGILTVRGVWRNGEHGITAMTKPTSLVISPDGRGVYVSGGGLDGGVVGFTRDPTSGDLTFAGVIRDGDGPGPQMSPPGSWTPGPSGPGHPAEPAVAGHVGVSINNGAQYTNNPNVRVAVVAPAGAPNLLLSNDGGFRASKRFAVRQTVAWRLDSSGPERLPKTIYARFGQSSQTFQDDIILDETAPRIVSATVAPQDSRAGSRAVGSKAKKRRRSFRVKILARDQTSGVGHVQVTVNKRKPGALLAYRRQVTIRSGGKAPQFIRVRDRAGNYSAWKRLKVAKRTKG